MSSIKQFWVEGEGKKMSLYVKIKDGRRKTTFTLEITGDSIYYYRSNARVSPPKNNKKDEMRGFTPAAHLTTPELQDLFETLIKAHLDYEVLVQDTEAYRFENRFKMRGNKRERKVVIEERYRFPKSVRHNGFGVPF